MIEINVPGYRHFRLEHLVLDYNGTLSRDGILLEGIEEKLKALAPRIRLHILTADTHGDVSRQLPDIPCVLTIIGTQHQDREKLAYVEQLGTEKTASIGNGRNDRLMLKKSALGIAVLQDEGTAVETLLAADVLTRNIIDALDLLLHPLRLTATLRN